MANPSAPTVWTIKHLLAWTTDFLRKKGIDGPRLDAQILLAHVLKVPRIELIARSDDEPTADERAAFKALVQRRVDGCPVAYLTGTKEFYLLEFEVSPAVLVPRPDTETLVEHALRPLKAKAGPRVLDLCTGSGCVAVTVAHNHKSAAVVAVDISPASAAVAERNAARHAVADRVAVRVGDLFGPVTGERFDVITANPPYIAHAEFATLPTDVRNHEPRLALDGGPDGLEFYRRIAAGATDFLTPSGTLLVEVGHTQAAAVRELFAATPGLTAGAIHKDGGGRPRVVTAGRT
jgi:release factor glutamine methyltransferase